MIQHFISRRGSDDLILFFAGWGMDTRPFAELEHIGCDCCICYDYTTLDFDTSLLADYKNIELYAWSFGVWAASVVLPDAGLPIRHATAINGTPCGIDPERGISPEIFRATLDHLDAASLNKFYRRMCNDRDTLNRFLEVLPDRDIDSLRSELAAIGSGIARHPASRFHWDRAIVGTKDRIFPPENQLKAWEGNAPVTTVEAAHYLPFRPIVLERRFDKAIIQSRFESAASTYEQEGLIQDRIARRLNEMVPDQPADECRRILEIGCGTGKLTRLLVERFPQARFTLNDLSPEMKRHVEGLPFEQLDFVAGDAERIDFAGPYDLIVSASTIQWFTDLEGFLKRISSRISDSGTIAFSSFVAGNLPEIRTLASVEMPYWQYDDLQRLFSRYFQLDTFARESYTLLFDTPVDLLRHLRNTGVTGTPGNRHKGFNFIKRYRETFGEAHSCTLTYCPVYIIAHKKR